MLKSVIKLLIFSQLLIIQHFAKAQLFKQNNYNIEANFHYGTFLKPQPSMGYLIKGHIPAFDLKFSKSTTGDKLWEQLYRYPETGFGLYFADFRNPQIIGNGFSVYQYIDIPIITSNIFCFSYNLSYGLAYISKKFDADNNFYNIAIGSNLNCYGGIALNCEITLTSKLNLISTLGYTHFSNGSISQPNLGLNVISCRLGLKYKFYNSFEKKNQIIPVFKRSNELIINYSCGYKSILPPESRKYFISSLSLNLQRLLNYKRSVGVGFDIFYDNSLSEKYKSKSIEYTNIYLFRSGLYLSHELFLGNTSIVTQFGGYIYQKYYENGDFYSRIGVRYKITKNISTNIFLKTHFASADCIEWGIGYHFN